MTAKEYGLAKMQEYVAREERLQRAVIQMGLSNYMSLTYPGFIEFHIAPGVDETTLENKLMDFVFETNICAATDEQLDVLSYAAVYPGRHTAKGDHQSLIVAWFWRDTMEKIAAERRRRAKACKKEEN